MRNPNQHQRGIPSSIERGRDHSLRELRRTVDELSQRNAELQHRQRMQGELTQHIVHDLKNPLGVAQANIQYVLGKPEVMADPDVSDALRDAEESVRRLLMLVDDLTSVAGAEDARLPVHRKKVTMSSLLDVIVRRQQRNAAERWVSLDVVMEGDADLASELFVDPSLMRRAIENLVDNALRHTPRAGRVQLSASVIQGTATFTISNTGRPVPEIDRERIFEKFARATSDGTRVERVGPGLCLYFCRRAAEAHGGSLEVMESAAWPARLVMRVPDASRV